MFKNLGHLSPQKIMSDPDIDKFTSAPIFTEWVMNIPSHLFNFYSIFRQYMI